MRIYVCVNSIIYTRVICIYDKPLYGVLDYTGIPINDGNTMI